jgi:threonine/homoserine/homoserine lactone efflux protein
VPTPSTIGLFALAAILLLLVPGPSVLYIVTRSVDQGRRAGLVSVLGIHAGSVVHVAAAALGISALIAASATAFDVVRYAGALYLIVLGLRTILGADAGDPLAAAEPRAMRRVFGQAAVVNVLNPKTAIFFVAFVPQFVDPNNGSTTTQILALGAVFIMLGLVSDSAYALAAARAGTVLRRSTRFRRRQRMATGSIYLALGAAAALAGRRP